MSVEGLSRTPMLPAAADGSESRPDPEPTQFSGHSDNVFEKWFETTQRNEMTLVVVGRSGVGKSTLISNLLRLSNEDTTGPKSLHSPSSFDKEVKTYSSLRGEVTVHIVDTPGLTGSDFRINHSKAIAELQEKTGGKCDAILYCVSLLPDSKVGKSDENLMTKLTRVFGEEMWKQIIVVFTFANLVKALYPNQSIEVLVKEYAHQFQSVLRRVCPSFSVVSIYSCDHEQVTRCPMTIVALPAGKNPDERFVDNLPMGWNKTVFLEVLKKSNARSTPVVLKFDRLSMPRIVRHAYVIGRFIVGTGVLMTISVGTCYYFGKVIGLFLERFVMRGCDFVYSFPTLGLIAGLLVTGPMCALEMVGDVHEYDAEEVEFDGIQDEVEKCRKL